MNASGGLEGHPVDLIYFDDAGSPGMAATDAATLISDHVAAIVDLSFDSSAWAAPVTAAKIPVIGGEEDTVIYVTNPDFYSTSETQDALVYSEVALAKQAGAKSAGIVACAESPACASELPLAKKAGNQLGIPDAYSALIPATAPSYTAQCVAAKQAKVAAMLVGVAGPTAQAFASDCARQGYDPIYIADDATDVPAYVTPSGLGKNFWVVYRDLPYTSNTPAVQALNAAIDRYYPGLRQSKTTFWTEESALAWTNGLLIADAVKASGVGASGRVTAAAITRGLHSLKGDTLDGWTPPLTYTAGKPTRVDCWFALKEVNGIRTMLNNGKPTCHNLAP